MGRKEWATIDLYGPNALGYTQHTMVGTMGSEPERARQSPKPNLSSDRGLQPTLVKLESPVIAFYQSAVNKSLRLAHTAHQANRMELR